MDRGPIPESLRRFFAAHPKIALAYSGGTDSAYLLYAAVALKADVHAYYVHTQFQPAFERADAARLADDVGAPLTIVSLDVLGDEAVAANPPNRCYHCKRALFGALMRAARRDGYQTVIDGTNASDDAGDRPGMRALEEMQVLSPLRLSGITKAQVRAHSKAAGLFTWDKPAYACLATRIEAHVPITQEALDKVERAEDALAAFGFRDFRVRVMDGCARIQLPDDQFDRMMQRRGDVLGALSPDFAAVLLDMQARRGE